MTKAACHVPVGTPIQYANVPPASGTHFPITAPYGVYERPVEEGLWVHNLEHGAIALLYRCVTDCDEVVPPIEAIYGDLPNAAFGEVKLIALPYASLVPKYMLVAWHWQEPMDSFDPDRVREFYPRLRGPRTRGCAVAPLVAMRFAILSDAHMISPGAAPQHGVDARVNLEAAVCKLAGIRPAPQLVVHLGDQTNTPSPAAYAEFARITRDVTLPQLFVQGNHDDGAMLADALKLPNDVEPMGAPDGFYALVRGGVQFVVLNSNPVGGGVGGRVGADQLAWLDATLAARDDETTVLFVHHHCHPIGIDWLDRVMLTNAADLMAVLGRHDRVLGVFSGHVHRRTSGTVAGIRTETAPSTWITLGPDRANPHVDAYQGFLVVDVDRRRAEHHRGADLS